jgi:uncharacterized protein (TIGR02596 family)
MNKHIPHLPQIRASRAFTLIELLAVMAIIAVVIAFAIPAANQVMKGSQMSQGSQQLADQMSYARQLALSKNHAIEVRFYRYGDPETPGEKFDEPTTGKWRAFQLFEILPNGASLPVGEMKRLPRMVVLDGDKYSTLLSETYRGVAKKGEDDNTAPDLPVEILGQRVAKKYDYQSFRFMPDGSTDLTPRAKKSTGGTSGTDDSWYITVVGLGDVDKPVETINFYTIQLDAVSGTTKAFRPNAG